MESIPHQLQALILLIIVVLTYLGLSAIKVRYFEPIKLFLIPWIIMCTFLTLGFIDYDLLMTNVSFLTIVLTIYAFVLGGLFSKFNRRGNGRIKIQSEINISPVSLNALALGSLIYVIVQIQEIIQFIMSGGLDSITFGELRQAHWEKYWGDKVSWSRVAKSTFRILSIVFAVGVYYFFIISNKKYITLSILVWFALLSESMLQGGRFLIVFLIMTSAYFYAVLKNTTFVSNRRKSFATNAVYKNIVIITVISSLFIGIFVVFPLLRNPDVTHDFNKFLQLKHDAKLSNWVEKTSSSNNHEWISSFSYGTSYLSLPIVKHTFFIKEAKINEWYELGGYNFPLYYKTKSLFTGKENEWLAIRKRISDISEAYNYNPNPWATGIRDLLIDFGYVGTFFLILVLGYLSQFIFEQTLIRKDIEWYLLLSFVGSSCIIFAFLSPLLIGVVNNSLIICIMLVSFRMLLRQRSN